MTNRKSYIWPIIGVLLAVIVEFCRRYSEATAEGEGSAIITFLLVNILGFPTNLAISAILVIFQRFLSRIPWVVPYLFLLGGIVVNWTLAGRLFGRSKESPH